MRKCQFSKITILTVFMCLITASKDVRQKLIEFQRRTVKSTTITGDTSKPASVSCRQSRWKTTKDTVKLNSTINQLDFIDIYRILHPVSAVYTLFWRSQKHSQRQTTFWALRQTLINFKNWNNTKYALRPQ